MARAYLSAAWSLKMFAYLEYALSREAEMAWSFRCRAASRRAWGTDGAINGMHGGREGG